MNYQTFVEIREVRGYEPDHVNASVDMDDVVIMTREVFQEVDCFRFFLRCGYILYVEATAAAIELVDGRPTIW